MFGIASASKVSLAMNVSGGAVRPVLNEARRSYRTARGELSNHLFSSAKGRMTGSRIFVTTFVTAVKISEHDALHHGDRRRRLVRAARASQGKSDHHPGQKRKNAKSNQIRRVSDQL